MSSEPKTLTAENFDEIISGAEKPVVVDFWATWCGPCKMFGPTFHEAAEEMEGQAIFGKLNVDEAEEIARRYKVMSIPTVIIFKGGQPVKKSMGVLPKGSLLDMVKDYL